jgi:hypothetical protein
VIFRIGILFVGIGASPEQWIEASDAAKIEDIQCATRDSGDRDHRFRDRDRRFRKLTRNRSRSNEIAGHVGPKQLVTIKRNDWSRSPKYAVGDGSLLHADEKEAGHQVYQARVMV